MIVVLIHYCHVIPFFIDVLQKVKPGETAAYYHYSLPRFHFLFFFISVH